MPSKEGLRFVIFLAAMRLSLLLLLALPAVVQAQWSYSINTNNTSTITITGYTGNDNVVSIPTNIDGLTVTDIGRAALYDTTLTSITIPGSITTIGDYAFTDCQQLTNIMISNGIEIIGSNVFSDCLMLTNVIFPESVTSIGVAPFFGCTRLSSIMMSPQNSFYSSTNGVLFDKNQTTLLQYPAGLGGNYSIPNTVTNILDYAFFDSASLANVNIPGTVTTIGSWAFGECYSLTNITIPSSITSIGEGSFGACNHLTSIYFLGNAPAITAGDNDFSGDPVTIYYLTNSIGWTNPFNYVTALPWNVTNTSITVQPKTEVVSAYGVASFNVTAIGTEPLSYQWMFDNTNIPGAISSTLTITNVAQKNLGMYSVIVSNYFGSAISSNTVLEMYPSIVYPFSGAITYWGKSATLNVGAWGTGPLSYQWYDNGAAILNATNSSLSLSNIQFTNAGFYSVIVANSLGRATNSPAEVVVNPAGVSLGFCPALTISGVVGYSYIIQSAPNLTDSNAWVTLTTLTLTQPVQLWVDTNVDASSPFNSKYFYRILPGQ